MSDLEIFVDGRRTGARFHVSHRISNAGYGLDHLHGHTYEMKVQLSGKREASFLYPFEELMRIITECAAALNNRVLLASGGGNVAKFEDGSVTYISADGRRYMFPKTDIVTLPVEEVTAEALARYLLGEIRDKIRKSKAKSDAIADVELTLWEGNERGIVAKGAL